MRRCGASAPRPTGADVHHVNVRRPGTGEKRQQPIPSPEREVIQQKQAHRRALECEAAAIRLDLVEPRTQYFGIILFQGGVIASDKGPTDLLQTMADVCIARTKAPASERRLIGRKTKEESVDPTAQKPHVAPASVGAAIGE